MYIDIFNDALQLYCSKGEFSHAGEFRKQRPAYHLDAKSKTDAGNWSPNHPFSGATCMLVFQGGCAYLLERGWNFST